MNNKIVFSTLICIALGIALFAATALAGNGRTTASLNDLRLWYNSPAMEWTEALPVGNGRLGGMVFGGVEKERTTTRKKVEREKGQN